MADITDHAEIVSTIRALPGRIEPLVAGRTREDIAQRPSQDEWSALEVCCHLRDSGEISVQRIDRLATEDETVLEPYDEGALALERKYREDDLGRVLQALRSAWSGLADLLASLPESAWQRAGAHPERGAVSIDSEARRYADHARLHLQQIEAVLHKLPTS